MISLHIDRQLEAANNVLKLRPTSVECIAERRAPYRPVWRARSSMTPLFSPPRSNRRWAPQTANDMSQEKSIKRTSIVNPSSVDETNARLLT